MIRTLAITLFATFSLFLLFCLFYTSSSSQPSISRIQENGVKSTTFLDYLPSFLLPQTASASFKVPSKAIMGKIANATQKYLNHLSITNLVCAYYRAELGRSTWHLLHVMSVKFPVVPTIAEKQAFLDFISLFRYTLHL